MLIRIDRKYMTKATLRGHPIYAFLIYQYESLIWLWRQARSFSLSSRVNFYRSAETWPCKFWLLCVCCFQGGCRAESITIGMWTWLLERLCKSHRTMMKNSVQASLQPHQSGCLHKGTVPCKKNESHAMPHPENILGRKTNMNLIETVKIWNHVWHRAWKQMY